MKRSSSYSKFSGCEDKKSSKKSLSKNKCIAENEFKDRSKNLDINKINTPLAMLSTLHYEDNSLKVYRNGLIPEQNLICQKSEARLEINSVKLVRLHERTKIFEQAYKYDKNTRITFDFKQKSLYQVQINVRIFKNLLMGLKIENSVFKGPIRLAKQTYIQGSYAPLEHEQELSITIATPGGIMGRGKYNGQAIIKDKTNQIYSSIKYCINIA